MSGFTPWPALAGGLLIGLAAVLLLAANGRIAGVAGIAAGALRREPGTTAWEGAWRWLFLLGLVIGAALWGLLAGPIPAPRQGVSPALLVLAGLLVGYGTSLGGGCTSGHGVCGLARLSLRSGVATGVFLAVAIVTTFVVRHLLQVAI